MNVKFHNIISWFFNILLIALLPIGYEVYENKREKIAQLEIENQEKTIQIVQRNEIINRHYNEFNQLVIEREICETTQEIIEAENELINQVINEYDNLVDSLSYIAEYRIENIDKINGINKALVR